MKYTLDFIKGTEKWVLDELASKHPDIKILEKGIDMVIFSSVNSITNFKDILGGIRITPENSKNSINLFRRNWRKEFVPAGINPALAYIMCEIAEIREDDVILDPFCGGGTIPITASLYFNPKKVIASDISGKAIEITQKNASNAGIQNISIFRSDVGRLNLSENSISKIITNLPFGIREKSHLENLEIYNDFAKLLSVILVENGKAIILTQELSLLQETLLNVGIKKIEDYPINQGGLKPHIFVFKK
jgi:tRNA (guanine6-N2)-methyltransferase